MDLMILGWELPALLVAGWLALWVSRRRIPAWYFVVAIGACFASFLLGLAGAVLLNARGTGDKFEGASKDLSWVPFFNSLIGVCIVAILLLLTGIIELARHLLSRHTRPNVGT